MHHNQILYLKKTVFQTIIFGNMAHLYHLYGGAISLSNSISSFDDCLFDSNNVNSDGHNSHGGTIHFDKTSGTFKNCSFINSTTYAPNDHGHGGAFYCTTSSCIFIDCHFKDCSVRCVTKGYSYGGTIYFDKTSWNI